MDRTPHPSQPPLPPHTPPHTPAGDGHSGRPDPLPARRARTLLRKLRDLNLSAARIAVHPRLAVSIAGCASLDLPAETELRYRVRTPLCEDEELVIALEDGSLRLARWVAGGEQRVSRLVTLLGGSSGPATVPELGARMDPDTAGARETERFLRRLVRAVFPRNS